MKQKFLRIKTDDTQFDVPMPENAIMPAVAENLQTRGFLIFDHLIVMRDAIKYLALYDMDVDETHKQEDASVINFTKPPRGFEN